MVIAELQAAQRLDPDLPEPPDVSALARQLYDQNKENSARDQQARSRELHRLAVDELTAASTSAENLAAAIDARTAEKLAALDRATMPIPGLGFGDGDVLYDVALLAGLDRRRDARVGRDRHGAEPDAARDVRARRQPARRG